MAHHHGPQTSPCYGTTIASPGCNPGELMQPCADFAWIADILSRETGYGSREGTTKRRAIAGDPTSKRVLQHALCVETLRLEQGRMYGGMALSRIVVPWPASHGLDPSLSHHGRLALDRCPAPRAKARKVGIRFPQKQRGSPNPFLSGEPCFDADGSL